MYVDTSAPSVFFFYDVPDVVASVLVIGRNDMYLFRLFGRGPLWLDLYD